MMGWMKKSTRVMGLDGRSHWREIDPCYDGVDDTFSLSQGGGQRDGNGNKFITVMIAWMTMCIFVVGCSV